MISTPLGIVAKIIAGQSPPSSTYNSTGDGLPFFQGKADFQEMYPRVRMWCKSSKRKEAEPGDILISVRAPVGAVNICNQKSIIGRGLSAIRPSSSLNGLFLYYFLKANEGRIGALGTGSTFKAITQETLKRFEIPLLPLDDQKRIAHLLGKVEGLIARRKQHLQQLEDLLKSVFLEMFGDPVEMKQQQHFPLGESIEFLTSGSRGWAKYYSDTGSIFLRINNVKDAHLKLDDIVYVNAPNSAEANRTRVRAGDLLLSITADLGRTAVVPGELDGSYINQHLALIRIQSNAGFNPTFLAWYFTLPYGNSFIQRKNREGVKAGLNFDDIRSFQVVRPPIDLQNHFAAIVEKVESLKSSYQQSLTDLENLYGALSQKAFKGELDLSRVPLPLEFPTEDTEEVLYESPETETAFELAAPADLEALKTPDGRKSLMGEWMTAWVAHLEDAAFASQEFMEAARKRLWELADDEATEWGVGEYDELKTWVFEALEQGRLTQSYDDAHNRVQITAARG